MVYCSEYVATVRHVCDWCEHPIFPGDRYYKYVSFHGSWPHRSIRVRKEHAHPGCIEDPEPPNEEREDHAHPELPLAA